MPCFHPDLDKKLKFKKSKQQEEAILEGNKGKAQTSMEDK